METYGFMTKKASSNNKSSNKHRTARPTNFLDTVVLKVLRATNAGKVYVMENAITAFFQNGKTIP